MPIRSVFRMFGAGLLAAGIVAALWPVGAQAPAPGSSAPLNIIAFGAHPDDCDSRAGGTAALWAAAGHKVRFVSVTNGDAGHQSQGGGALGARRRAEARDAGRRIGVDYIVLDNHDGELMPDLHVRQQIIRLIREWKADLVLGPRTNDYHPDHRYTGVLLQDAAFMVTVPNVTPDTPALRVNPVFLYFEDSFQKPAPFSPDVAVDIDAVFSKKIHMLDAHASQFYEWLPWLNGKLDQVPTDTAARQSWLAQQRSGRITPAVRAKLIETYGADAGAKVQHAEAFGYHRVQGGVPTPRTSPACSRSPGGRPSSSEPTMSELSPPATLERRFGLLQATALNMSNMIGIGPFITIPLLMSALGGPQALLGWAVALVIVVADGLVWSELGAAMPGSGGSYRYLREGFGRERWGRLVGFLFIWQFLLSGPLEIASGYIGFARYLRYVWADLPAGGTIAVAMAVGVLNIALLYRRIASIGTLTVSLWAGTILTTLAVMVTGALHFDPAKAFDVPPGAFSFSMGFLFGLGAASRVGIYDYLGYYSVAYIGDEVVDPGRVIPRSILISVVAVALIYIGINLSILGVVPWREFVPAAAHPESDFIVSTFMERVYGPRVATLFTALVLWTAFGSVFALLLGYSRIPYAAAVDGTFFRIFARVHPTKHFPHVSLLLIGGIAVAVSTLSLGIVIDALITTRILVQFIGQIVALSLLRRNAPGLARPFTVWWYPLPNLIALFGWIFLFATSGPEVILFGLGTLLVGIGAFFVWSWRTARSRAANRPGA